VLDPRAVGMRDAHTIVSPARCRARRSGHAAVDRRAWSAANSETTPAADHERAEQRNQATDHRQPGTGAQIGVGQVGGVVVTGVQPDPQAGRGERDLRPRPSGGPPRQGSSRPGSPRAPAQPGRRPRHRDDGLRPGRGQDRRQPAPAARPGLCRRSRRSQHAVPASVLAVRPRARPAAGASAGRGYFFGRSAR
jgi:hypothetical protein